MGANTNPPVTTRPVGDAVPMDVAIVDGSGAQITTFGGGTQYAEDTAHVSGDTMTLAGVVQQSADSALSNNLDRTVLQVDETGFLKVNVKAGGGGYTEDSVAAADPVGGVLMLVRKDTPATITSTDGDNIAQRGTNYGAAYTQIVTSTGSFVDAFGGSGGTAQADESAFTEGTTSLTPVGGVLNDTIVSDPAEDQTAAFRITAKRALHTNLRNVAGTEVGTATDPVRVDPTGTTTQPVSGTVAVSSITTSVTPGTAAANLGKAVDSVAGATDTGIAPLAVRDDALSALTPIEGDYVPLRTDANGALWVHDDALDAALAGAELQVDVVGALPTGANTIGTVNIGTFPDNEPFNVAQYGGTAVVTGGTAGTVGVAGIQAHDAALSGNNPVLIGASMETMADSAPSSRAGTDADLTRLATTDGALFVIPTGPQTWSYHENSSSALTDASVHAAPGAGLSLYVTDIICSTGAATALNIFFEEGASTVLGPYYLEAVAGRGLAIHFGTPKKITANTALTVTTSAAIAHGIDVTGFIAPG